MFYLVFAIGVSLLSNLFSAPLQVAVSAESALLINADTGAVLYEKNSDQPLYPASITKVATALYALKVKKDGFEDPIAASSEAVGSVTEEAKRKSNYTLPAWWLVPGSSHIGIKKGEILSFKDLMYGMLLASGDDAANVIAEATSGNIPDFMKGMNDYLKTLGCTKTYFANPHGLFHPDQKTTCRDMALIMREALKDPFFKKIIGTVTYTRPKTNKQESNVLVQTNRLLRPGPFYYSKTIGGKTGYISAAQNTFVVAAQNKGRTLIAVFMKTKERSDLWRDSIKLFDAAFNQPLVERVYLKKGQQKYTLNQDSFKSPLETYTKEDLTLSYYPAEEPKAKGLLVWNNVSPPIKKDEPVGEFRIVDAKGEILKSTQLFAANNVKGTFGQGLEEFFNYLLKTKMGWFIMASLAILGFLFYRFKK